MTTHRVGPIQWIILGALAQAPDQVLTRDRLLRHLRDAGAEGPAARSIVNLLRSGCIDDTERGGTYRLTEFGANCRRDSRPSSAPRFLPLLTGRANRLRD